MPIYKVKIVIDDEFEVSAADEDDAIQVVYEDLDLTFFTSVSLVRDQTEEEREKALEEWRKTVKWEND